ncbi:MAG: ester cyclase [Pseudomonadota bacterium]
MTEIERAKAVVAPLLRMWDCSEKDAAEALSGVLAPEAVVNLAFPFGTLTGPQAFFEAAIQPLYKAMPDLERRDMIRIAGRDDDGALWVGNCGHWIGTFSSDWIDIQPTGRTAYMRYHEFYRIEDRRAVEVQALWDIPELMLQAGAWPLSPALGREMMAPAPAQDGLNVSGDGTAAMQVVGSMLDSLSRNREGVAAMELDRHWHPRCLWFGPAGIGTARGIQGFRRHHQIPFLAAMPDRGANPGHRHHFAEGDFVAFTGWPGMRMTLNGDGWLGIPPMSAKITMRSLDFWRVEAGKIRENWVLVDLLDVYDQIGVDVFARMRELQGVH